MQDVENAQHALSFISLYAVPATTTSSPSGRSKMPVTAAYAPVACLLKQQAALPSLLPSLCHAPATEVYKS